MRIKFKTTEEKEKEYDQYVESNSEWVDYFTVFPKKIEGNIVFLEKIQRRCHSWFYNFEGTVVYVYEHKLK